MESVKKNSQCFVVSEVLQIARNQILISKNEDGVVRWRQESGANQSDFVTVESQQVTSSFRSYNGKSSA